MRKALAQDLDAPGALAAVDAWASGEGKDEGGVLVAEAIDALLGIRL
jgi:L-cysteine:1D-myo-inositol 2-amino-2-deoxy-alpha-D-glucopyranoside ligase